MKSRDIVPAWADRQGVNRHRLLRKKVKEVTMDFSDSMMGIVKKEFPQAEIVIDQIGRAHV